MNYLICKINNIPDFIKNAEERPLADNNAQPIRRKKAPLPPVLRDLFKNTEEQSLERISQAAKKRYPFSGEKKGMPLLTYLMEHPLEFMLESKSDFLDKWQWLQKEMEMLIDFFNLKIFSSNEECQDINYIWENDCAFFDRMSPKRKNKMSLTLSRDENVLSEYMKYIKTLFKLPSEHFDPEKNSQEYLHNWLLKDLDQDRLQEIFIELNIHVKETNPVKKGNKKKEEEEQGLLPF